MFDAQPDDGYDSWCVGQLQDEHDRLKAAVRGLRAFCRYHDKPRIHSHYRAWDAALRDIDEICQFEVDGDGVLNGREEIIEEWSKKS